MEGGGGGNEGGRVRERDESGEVKEGDERKNKVNVNDKEGGSNDEHKREKDKKESRKKNR